MTNSNIFDISTQNFNSDDKLFFDTNVWLDIHYQRQSGRNRVAKYSAALRDIKAAGSKIFLAECVISEFINSYARMEWDIATKKTMTFKQFRETSQFTTIAQDISLACKQILLSCSWCNSGCTSQDIDSILHAYAAGDKDFNDQIISHLCTTDSIKLVTHDADFANCGITMITANNNIL